MDSEGSSYTTLDKDEYAAQFTAVAEMIKSMPPNPTTGRIGFSDMLDYVQQHRDELPAMAEKWSKIQASQPKVDSEHLRSYDYTSLRHTIKQSHWGIWLEYTGFIDDTGNLHKKDKVIPGTNANVQRTFDLSVLDGSGLNRIEHECVGMPDPSVLLEVLQRAIVAPDSPFEPGLPLVLQLCADLAAYAESLRPFLDSLPKPFSWKIQTKEKALYMQAGYKVIYQASKTSMLALLEKHKNDGNKAFAVKDRLAAIDSYTKALEYVDPCLRSASKDKKKREIKRLQAICFSNRAAAHLLPGTGNHPQSALEDGMAAEKADPGYNKSYIRQASAHQQLGNDVNAKGAISRALKRHDLKDDVGLVNRFIELITNGRGFPEDNAAFEKFLLDIDCTILAKGINGLFKRELDAHRKRLRIRL